ncbi:hypothetical protein NE237_012802 [Protea cynaroides]|uniref:Uncharacterized protein n=1 Tax=Protea cynaroides TaxID=273540 RepID=A0A9Q0H2K6_9MAGN|nr:hypothetical protein NE237_012802 [Protea cynaroides]
MHLNCSTKFLRGLLSLGIRNRFSMDCECVIESLIEFLPLSLFDQVGYIVNAPHFRWCSSEAFLIRQYSVSASTDSGVVGGQQSIEALQWNGGSLVLNETRWRLGTFQICALCICCGGTNLRRGSAGPLLAAMPSTATSQTGPWLLLLHGQDLNPASNIKGLEVRALTLQWTTFAARLQRRKMSTRH